MAAYGDVLRVSVRRIIPAGLVIGAGMESFMYFTGELEGCFSTSTGKLLALNTNLLTLHRQFAGFWKVATKKEAERQEESKETRRLAREVHEKTQRRTLFDVHDVPAETATATSGGSNSSAGSITQQSSAMK